MENIGRKKQKLILWEALPEAAGGQRVCLDVIRALRGICDSIVIVPSKGGFSQSAENEGAICIEIPFSSYSLVEKGTSDIVKYCIDTPSVVRKAVSVIKEVGPSAIYASSSRVFAWSAIAGKITSVPVIWHLHNILGDRKTKILIKLLSHLNSVKCILSDSKSAALQYGEMADRVSVIYNGVDLLRFFPSDEKRKEFRNEFGIPSDAIVAGTVSDLIPHKGQMTFIEAMEAKCRDNSKLYGVIVGRAREGFEWYVDKLKAEVARAGLEERILFTGFRSDIEKVLNGIDILVVPSYSSESFPLIILESFACGTVVTASAFSGMTEVISEGNSGFLFKTANSTELASKIALLTDDQVLLQKMRKFVINEAKERYDIAIFNSAIRKSFSHFVKQPV